MRADEIRVGQLIGPVVVDVEGSFTGTDDTFEVEFPRRGAGGRLLLVHQGRPHSVVSVGASSQTLERLADSTTPTISWAQRIDEHTVLVEVRVFDAELSTGTQTINVPEEVALDLLARLGAANLDDSTVREEFVIPDAGFGERHLIASGAAPHEVELVGRNCRLRIDFTAGLRAISINSTGDSTQRELLRLNRGAVHLTDAESVNSPLISALANSTAPMFELWDTYNRLEREAALDRAAVIGQARHGKPEYRGDLVVLPIRATEDAEFLSELSRERSDIEVEIVPQGVGFDSYSRSLERFIGTVEHVDTNAKTLSVRPRRDRPGVITNDGLVRPYLGGSEVQAKRRDEVYRRLQSGDYGIESLGYLLRE
jgi:hypothetical protein